MTWMQEAARRIDISKRSFLIETISSQYVTYAFSHLYTPLPPESMRTSALLEFLESV